MQTHRIAFMALVLWADAFSIRAATGQILLHGTVR
jgi:hypothetical protein